MRMQRNVIRRDSRGQQIKCLISLYFIGFMEKQQSNKNNCGVIQDIFILLIELSAIYGNSV